MRHERRSALLVLALPFVLGAALARADESPELERVDKALEQARADLDRETARVEAVRVEVARIGSAAALRRDNATARLEAARRERRDLLVREAAIRADVDRLTPLIDSSEGELAATRDVLRRLLADRVDRAGSDEGDAARLLARVDDATQLAVVARRFLELARDDARAAEQPVFSMGEVGVEGSGRAKGRILRWGPGAWFVGDGGLEAVRPLSKGASAPDFVRCEGQELAGAFAAIERGVRRVALPIVLEQRAETEGDAAHIPELVKKGGITMIPLALLSVLSVFTILERLLSRRRTIRRVRDSLVASTNANDARSRLLAELRRRLWILGTVGSSAPFVGLFGTVVGIVRAFEDMAHSGSAGFAVVAAGIAEALVATAAGIVVAVTAVIAYNALQAAATSAAEALAAELAGRAPRESEVRP